jgi:hypothetical protein
MAPVFRGLPLNTAGLLANAGRGGGAGCVGGLLYTPHAWLAPRLLWRWSLALLCVLAAGLVFSSVPVLAAHIYVLSGQFGSEGSGDGQLNGPAGLAVNQLTHDIYLADRRNLRVDQFTEAGAFVRTWGWGVTDGASSFEICDAPTVCREGVEGTGAGQFTGPRDIAVDNSVNPLDSSAGDVYVAPGDGRIEKFDSSGNYLASITSTSSGPFEGPVHGVAVDQEGNLWTYAEHEGVGRVSELTADGVSILSWDTGLGAGTNGIAIDGHENVYVLTSANTVEKFTPTGEDLGVLDPGNANASFLTADLSTGSLFVDERSFVAKYDVAATPPATPSAEFGAGTLANGQGVGIDPSRGNVYVVENSSAVRVDIFTLVLVPDVNTGPASNVQGTRATVSGTINPDGTDTTCSVEYGTTTSYGQRAPCSPADVGSGSALVPVSAELNDLQEATTYHYRVDATNANGTNVGKDETLTTLAPPLIDSTTATNITPVSVDLNAQINPMGFDTTYHFEYGTDTSYGATVPVPSVDIGSGTTDQSVTVHVTGLQPNTTYHYRVFAQNSEGVTAGIDHTFVYPSGGTVALPDGRAYEMVTPVYKGGSAVAPDSATVAGDGSEVLGLTLGGFAGIGNIEAAGKIGAWYAFTRTEEGWKPAPFTPAATQIAHARIDALGLDNSVWSSPTTAGGTDNGEEHFFLRSADGSLSDIGPVWPPSLGSREAPEGQYQVEGTASDASHVVFTITDSTFVWPFDSTVGVSLHNSSLYEYAGVAKPEEVREPQLVGVSGGAGSTALISQCGTALGQGWQTNGSISNAVSQSGTTVFFTALSGGEQVPPSYVTSACTDGKGHTGTAPSTNELYARLGGSQTVWVSQPACTRSAPVCHNVNTDQYTSSAQSENAVVNFEGASADGSKVFFTTTQQLTNGDTDSTTDLYEYDFNASPGQNLIQLSAGGSSDPTPGSGAQVQGVSRISQDGSHVYFVAQGVLSTNTNGAGASARAGADNLYVYEPDPANPGQHKTEFIARLCSGAGTSGTLADPQCPGNLNSEPPGFAANHNDRGLWSGGGWDNMRQISVSPDGRFAVFASYGDLTRDDSSTAKQVFEYDAQTGALVRISVGQDGFRDNGNVSGGDASIVALDSTSHNAIDARGGAIGRTMSDDGAYVLFQSPIGLTPGALNNVTIDSAGDLAQNIYEYHAGRVSLISDGRDTTLMPDSLLPKSGVQLVGVSATGRDVLFTTGDALVPQDTDTQLDIYDARIGGGFPASTPPGRCEPEACQGSAASPPLFTAPSSATFFGSGNVTPPVSTPAVKSLTRAQKLSRALKACRRKHNGHKRARCKSEARQRYGPMHRAKKARRWGK